MQDYDNMHKYRVSGQAYFNKIKEKVFPQTGQCITIFIRGSVFSPRYRLPGKQLKNFTANTLNLLMESGGPNIWGESGYPVGNSLIPNPSANLASVEREPRFIVYAYTDGQRCSFGFCFLFRIVPKSRAGIRYNLGPFPM